MDIWWLCPKQRYKFCTRQADTALVVSGAGLNSGDKVWSFWSLRLGRIRPINGYYCSRQVRQLKFMEMNKLRLTLKTVLNFGAENDET